MHRFVPLFLLNVIVGTMEFLLPLKFSAAHVSVLMTAVLFSTSSVFSLLLDIPSGKLSDRVGRNRLIGCFMLMVTAAALLFYFSSTVPVFFIAIILLGTSYGLCWSPLLALIGDGSEQDGGGFARYFRIAAIGEGIAPLIVAALLVRFDVNAPFLMVILLAAICLIFVMLEKQRALPKHAAETNSLSYASTLKLLKSALPLNLFLIATGFFVAFFWESVWFSQPLVGFYGDSVMDSALIVAAFALPSFLFSDLLGVFVRRYKERRVYLISAALAVLSFLGFYLSPGLGMKLGFIFIAAIGVQGIWLVMDVLAAKLHDGQRGEFFGLIETVRDIAYFASPLFIALTYSAIGLNGVFTVDAAAALILLAWGYGTLAQAG